MDARARAKKKISPLLESSMSCATCMLVTLIFYSLVFETPLASFAIDFQIESIGNTSIIPFKIGRTKKRIKKKTKRKKANSFDPHR